MAESKCTCRIEWNERGSNGPTLEPSDFVIARCSWCKSLLSTNTKLVELLKVATGYMHHKTECSSRWRVYPTNDPCNCGRDETLSQIKAEVK